MYIYIHRMYVSYAIIFAHRFLYAFLRVDDDVFRAVFFWSLPRLGVLISDVFFNRRENRSNGSVS